ncbi:hypothetical protein BDZ91DRAFT_844927 [Kalaharituber pfeilii]|nr:hypothetical protein BDZ91DRAFT_844927 [Kalaharituber pfeilii]
MEMLIPSPLSVDAMSTADSANPSRKHLNNSDNYSDSQKSPPSPKSARMRASYLNGMNGSGTLQLSAAFQHPLKSRENSPEHQFPRQFEQPIRTLSPVPALVHTPRLGYSSSSPPPSTTATSPEDVNTPPTTAVSSSAHSLWGGHHHRQLSELGTSYAPSPTPSNLSFEVLSGYSSISPAEKVRQHQRDLFYQQHRRPSIWERDDSPLLEAEVQYAAEFKPNADLPFPISEGLRRYYPHAQTHEGFLEEREPSPRKPPGPSEFFERFNTFANTAKQRFGAQTRPAAYRTEQMVMEEEEDLDESSHLYPSTQRDISMPMSASAVDESEVSRATSGIPSYTQEFGMQWRDPLPTESAHSTTSSVRRAAQATPAVPPTVPQATSKKDDNLISVYVHEITSQIDSILRKVKRPICFILVLGGLGLLISLLVNSLAVPLLCGNPGFATLSSCHNYYQNVQGHTGQSFANATYPDFPTLMNIESSFEKIVDGAAGGSALARAMKSSEMAVSDLSTVVRYSDLKCKESLSTKLDAFATDAKASVRALSGWGSKVGGVLDQLLSINQYSLRELNGLKEYENRKSFLSTILSPLNPILTPVVYKPIGYLVSMTSSNSNIPHASPSAPVVHRHSPQTRAQIAATFNKAAEVLEMNLRQLVGDGETIFTSLTHLSEQHKPIYDEIVREVVDIKKEEEVVLSSLWTKMGGNQIQRKNFRENAKLLEMIGKYEEEARGYVESTVLELDRMMADLEILRKRVAEPLLVGEGNMANIHMGVGAGDIPLQVHIEAIEKAVERLVRKRGERREREDSYLKALIDNNERGPKVDILVED